MTLEINTRMCCEHVKMIIIYKLLYICMCIHTLFAVAIAGCMWCHCKRVEGWGEEILIWN